MMHLVLSIIILATTSVQLKPTKSIKIFLPSQVLVCYENDSEVYRTRISSGRHWGYQDKTKYRKDYQVLGKDPAGENAVSIVKDRGRTTIASTPWKIILCNEPSHQIRIHDFASVPKTPASHGCIRTPSGKAKWIYHWVDIGTPVYFTLEKETKQKIQIPDTITCNNAPSIDRAFSLQ